MSASSDELEAFQDRLIDVGRQLGQLRRRQVSAEELIQALAALAKDWLRLSQALRDVDNIVPSELDAFDGKMGEVLRRTAVRTRAPTYRHLLEPLRANLSDQVITPLIKFEGSPLRVAARQLIATFGGNLSQDEAAYIQEAALCLASKCYRAALIMLWAAAMSRMHQAIETLGYAAYNTALGSCLAKSGNPFNRLSKHGGLIASSAQLQRSRDFDILVVGMELWQYDLQVFQELDRLLGSRNDAAHPGMYTPTVLDVQQFACKLNTYVFSQIKP